jgi:hypothetical protein
MASRATSSIAVAAPRADVMAVIADFASYPEWASAVRSAEVVGRDSDGRASRVRSQLDAGVIKDTYILSYDGTVMPRCDGILPSPDRLSPASAVDTFWLTPREAPR